MTKDEHNAPTNGELFWLTSWKGRITGMVEKPPKGRKALLSRAPIRLLRAAQRSPSEEPQSMAAS